MNTADNTLIPIPASIWQVGYGPKEYGQYLQNKRNYSHKRTNK